MYGIVLYASPINKLIIKYLIHKKNENLLIVSGCRKWL